MSQSLHFSNDIISAALHDRTLYAFNDKIGYFLDAASGARVPHLVETDNDRGFYTAGPSRYLQTSVELCALAAGGVLVSHLHLHLTSTAFGCFLP